MLQDVPDMVNDYFNGLGFRVEPDQIKPDYFRLVRLSPAEKKQIIKMQQLEESHSNENTTETRNKKFMPPTLPPKVVAKPITPVVQMPITPIV